MCLEDIATTSEPQIHESETPAESVLKGEPAEELPICYVEEIMCPDDYIPTCHAKKVPNVEEVLNSACTQLMCNIDMAVMSADDISALVGNETSAEAVTSDLHFPLLCVEHLALVFEL